MQQLLELSEAAEHELLPDWVPPVSLSDSVAIAATTTLCSVDAERLLSGPNGPMLATILSRAHFVVESAMK